MQRAGSFRGWCGLILVSSLWCGGCAATGSVPQPFPRPGGSPAAETTSVPGHTLAATGLSLKGVPYRPGGTDPSGFDCSGFVAYVFAQHRLSLPRTVPEQYRVGRPLGARAVQAGDLVFFRTAGRGPSHVGLAISPHEFVHAPSSTGVVRVEGLTSRYWSSRFVGARRLR